MPLFGCMASANLVRAVDFRCWRAAGFAQVLASAGLVCGWWCSESAPSICLRVSVVTSEVIFPLNV